MKCLLLYPQPAEDMWKFLYLGLIHDLSYNDFTINSIFCFIEGLLLIITVIWITYIKSGKGKGKSTITHDAIQVL